MMRSCSAAILVTLVAGCGEPAYQVESGSYQIITTQITGDCKLDYSLRPERLTVGSVMPAAVVATSASVSVKVCDHPDADPSCAPWGDLFDFGLSRDGNALAGGLGTPWQTGCGDPVYEQHLDVVGQVTDDNAISLTWTARVTSSDPNWMCNGLRSCESTIEQRMALVPPGM